MCNLIDSTLNGAKSRLRAFHPMRRYIRLRKKVTRSINRVRLKGDTVFCPCCGMTARDFLQRDICAFCDSRPRQRFLWLFLEDLICMGDSILHFAPEECLAARLRNLTGVGYVSADVSSIFADVRVDLTSESDVTRRLGSGAYSIVIISHVLEHVRDDFAALRSLKSLVSQDGYVLAQVPLDLDREVTYEDWTITTNEGRLQAFGQEDHVRMYGRDFADRLGKSGFRVLPVNPSDICSDDSISRMRLSDDTIFVCRPAIEENMNIGERRSKFAKPPSLCPGQANIGQT